MECRVSARMVSALQRDWQWEAENALVLSVLILCAKPKPR